MMCNITIFKNAFQYTMAKFNNAKSQLFLHQTNRIYLFVEAQSFRETVCSLYKADAQIDFLIQFSSVAHVWLFAIPWTAACQASLSIINSQIHSNSSPSSWPCHTTSVIHFSFCLQPFPASGSFPIGQFFISDGQSIGVSASASVLSINIQDWFILGSTGLILQSKGLSRVFSNTTFQKHQFFDALLSRYSPTLTSIRDYWKNHSVD